MEIHNLYRLLGKKIPASEADLILAHILKKDRAFILAHPEYRISIRELARSLYGYIRRLQGWSIARITGHKEFYGLDFTVNRHTLIPRPETELMVDLTLSDIQKISAGGVPYLLADIGTGSGCIPISILKKTTHLPQAAYATDISRGALRVARRNVEKHAVHLTCLQGNLGQPMLNTLKSGAEPILLTANLPYLTEQQFKEEPSIRHEPHTALVADENGLALYRELLAQLKKALADKRRTAYLFFEIDPSQAETLPALVRNFFPEALVSVATDGNGHERIVRAILNERAG